MRIYSPKSLAKLAGISAATALSISFANAATYQFNVSSGSLIDPANYTPTTAALQPADILQITNSGSATLTADETGSFTEVHLGQNAVGTATGILIQSGGSLTLADGLVVGRQGTAVGTYTMTGGSLTTRNLRVGGGAATARGTVTVSGVGTSFSTGVGATGAVVGIGSPGTGTFSLDQSATWTALNSAVIVGGDNSAPGTTGPALGGTGTLNIQGGAVMSLFAVNLTVGRNSNGNGTVNVTGGGVINMTNSGTSDAILNLANFNGASTLQTGANLPVATLTLSGGGSSITVPRVLTGPGNATLNLNGGSFTTGRFNKGTGNAAINFNGATMVALTESPDFYAGFSSADLNIQAGGQTFDTNGNAVTIGQGMTGTGGFTKAGAGTLTFLGANTYAGPTVIQGGVLAAGLSGALPSSSNLTLASGTFDLNGFDHTLGSLTLTATSTLDFNSLSFGNSLIFANSSSQAWSGKLNLQNFEVGNDTLSFSSPSGVTPAQLAAISLDGYQATGVDSTGVVQFTAVPEPGSLALLAFGGLLLSRRRRQK